MFATGLDVEVEIHRNARIARPARVWRVGSVTRKVTRRTKAASGSSLCRRPSLHGETVRSFVRIPRNNLVGLFLPCPELRYPDGARRRLKAGNIISGRRKKFCFGDKMVI